MTRNVEMLVRAAKALGDLREEVVFVGGAVVDLFIIDPAAPRPRFTEDVDVVVEVTTYAAWAELGTRLRALGFREDRREGAPLCRWLVGDLVIDVMPALERVLGFTNRWYRQAKKQSEERELPGDVRIRAVTAPLFLATAELCDERLRLAHGGERVGHAANASARRQLHLPTGDNYTSPSLRPAGQ